MPDFDPRFYYTIQSMRVDGDYSADARDYADRDPDQPVGEVLIGWLWGHLDPSLSPLLHRERGQAPEGMRFRVEEGVVLQFRPTPRDLARWAKVEVVNVSCDTLRADGTPIGPIRPARATPAQRPRSRPTGAPDPGFVAKLLARVRARSRRRK
jgi:hypothetical protein